MVRYTLPHFKKGSGPPDNKKLTSITEVPKKMESMKKHYIDTNTSKEKNKRYITYNIENKHE